MKNNTGILRARFKDAAYMTLQLSAVGFIIVCLGACGGGGGGGSDGGGDDGDQTDNSDKKPDAFEFFAMVDILPATWIASNEITVTGIDAPSRIRINGGEYSIDGGLFIDNESTVSNNQTVVVRQLSSSSFLTQTDATLMIGGVRGIFSVTTLAQDIVPDAFSFIDQDDVIRNYIIVSGPITVSGINDAAAISITGGEYSIDGGSYVSSVGTIANGQSVRVRTTSPEAPGASTEVILNIGGVNDTFNVISTTDVTPPVAAIVFPPSASLTRGDTLLVRVAASDTEHAVSEVIVNNVNAVPANDGTWVAEIPLQPGQNTFNVEATDSVLNNEPEADQDTIRSAEGFFDLTSGGIAVDAANNRALVTDIAFSAVVSVDLTTGEREIFSDADTPNTSNPLAFPLGLAVDAANNRALVVDNGGADAVIAVNLITGARTVFSNDTVPDSNNQFVIPRGIVLDSANNRALVLGHRRVYVVNLSTGARTLLSDDGIPDNNTPFQTPIAIALDGGNNRALVADTNQAVFAVNLDTGARTIMSTNTLPGANVQPSAIVVDSANNRALISETNNSSISPINRIVAIDLTTGVRSILSDNSTPNDANSFSGISHLTLDSANSRVLVVDRILNAIFAVNLTTGARTTVSSLNTPGTLNMFDSIGLLARDEINDRALIVSGPKDRMYAMDLANGARSIFSSNTVPDTLNPFDIAGGVAVDAPNNRVLVTDSGLDGVLAVNLDTGGRTVLWSTSDLGVNPSHITVDSANERAFVSTPSDGIFEIDLTTGTQTVFASPFSSPKGLVVDAANDRLLAVRSDGSVKGIISVDLDTGVPTTFSAGSVPNSLNQFENPNDIVLVPDHNRILVADHSAIYTVDMTTGARAVLSGGDIPNDNNQFTPSGIILDGGGEYALVVDTENEAVIAVDVVTGERVIFSK